MSFELLLTWGALLYTLILPIIYNNKQQFKNTRTTSYKFMLLWSIAFQISEIITIEFMKNGGSDTLVFIFWRIHYIFLIFWVLSLFYYISSMTLENEEKKFINIFNASLSNKIITILFLILPIAYFFLPWNPTDLQNMDLMPGNTEYILVPSLGILMGFLYYRVCSKKYIKNTTKSERISIIIIYANMLFASILQAIIPNISFIPMALLDVMYITYFYIENPDLKIIREINESQGNINQSNKTKTDFLSNMTTEIKVPMSLIISLCDELNGMPVYNEKLFKEDISQIQTSGNSLLDIVNNILDISKIETGKDTLHEKDYNIKSLLTDVMNIAKSKVGAKAVKLNLNVDQNISSVLHGDYSKLYQALINIVSNAAKYTEVGKITVTLTSNKSSGIENLQFKVSDTGTGIKPEDQSKIFTKGVRLENEVEGEVNGGGFGLVITKEYIEMLGGKIWFESQYRVGTTFYIEVPQKVIDATPIGNIAAVEEKKEESALADCSKYKVLIVDDNQLNIKVAKRLLEKYKFNVESVMSGKECVYKIKEGEKYDGIFMDHMMPEMDGIETLHVLKKLEGYTIPPVIALTANAIAGMREMYISEGFDEYLSKPISTSELDRIINLFFNK